MSANPNIIVMSRQDAVRASSHFDDRTAIVSISDHGSPFPEFADNPFIEDVLYLSFDDVESTEAGGMTASDANAVLDFASGFIGMGIDLVVHCGAGRSRSAGTAAALMLLMHGDDSAIFGSPRYSPNMHCYRSVLDAAGLGFSQDELDEKENAQRELWLDMARENGLI